MSKLDDIVKEVRELMNYSDSHKIFDVMSSLVKVKRDESKFTYLVCVPGCERKHLKLSVQKPFLLLSVDKQDEDSFTEPRDFHLYVSSKVNMEEITAWLERGILTIECPFIEQPKNTEESQEIQIHVL